MNPTKNAITFHHSHIPLWQQVAILSPKNSDINPPMGRSRDNCSHKRGSTVRPPLALSIRPSLKLPFGLGAQDHSVSLSAPLWLPLAPFVAAN